MGYRTSYRQQCDRTKHQNLLSHREMMYHEVLKIVCRSRLAFRSYRDFNVRHFD